MSGFKKFFGHLWTITYHKHLVLKHCAKAGIFWQGTKHDMSKFSPTEFILGVKYYTGDRSPNEGERKDLGYSKAWMHHKGRNKHHYEYWTDYDPVTKVYGFMRMPYRYVVEMFCDRMAASKVYRGKDYSDSDALNYFLRGGARNMMNEETRVWLEEMLTMLSQEGEKKTFQYIKGQVKVHKKDK